MLPVLCASAGVAKVNAVNAASLISLFLIYYILYYVFVSNRISYKYNNFSAALIGIVGG